MVPRVTGFTIGALRLPFIFEHDSVRLDMPEGYQLPPNHHMFVERKGGSDVEVHIVKLPLDF